MYAGCIWPLSVQNHLMSFGAFVSKWPVTQKTAGSRERRIEICYSKVVAHVYGIL